MNNAASPEVTHSRPVPPAWNSLVGLAQSQLDASGRESVDPSIAYTLIDAVSAIDNEPLEAARYYGLGLVMCHFAQKLNDPDTRNEIVDHAATVIVDTWRQKKGNFATGELCIDDIDGFPVAVAFNDISQAASDKLPPAARLVADALTLETVRRIDDLKQNLASARSADEKRESMVSGILAGNKTAQYVSENAAIASMAVLRVALGKKHALNAPHDQSTTNPTSPEEPTTVVKAADEEGIEGLEWEPVAQRCAVLRRDEFILDLDQYVDVGSDGKTVFRRDRVVPSRELPAAGVTPVGDRVLAVIHNTRLKCPAVFVGINETSQDPKTTEIPEDSRATKARKASKGLNALTVEVVGEIVAVAQARIRTEVALITE